VLAGHGGVGDGDEHLGSNKMRPRLELRNESTEKLLLCA